MWTSPGDPYSILGVDRDASNDQIRAAFRDAIRRAHPDRSGETANHQSVIDLIDAWKVLRDPTSRAALDRNQRPGDRGALPSDEIGWQPIEVRTSQLVKRLFLITMILTIAAISVLFVIAMAQSG
jgi:DnaJ-class molecular chaperone